MYLNAITVNQTEAFQWAQNAPLSPLVLRVRKPEPPGSQKRILMLTLCCFLYHRKALILITF
jgi:hypothetical protein